MFLKLKSDGSIPKCFDDYLWRWRRIENALARKQSKANRRKLTSALKRHQAGMRPPFRFKCLSSE